MLTDWKGSIRTGISYKSKKNRSDYETIYGKTIRYVQKFEIEQVVINFFLLQLFNSGWP